MSYMEFETRGQNSVYQCGEDEEWARRIFVHRAQLIWKRVMGDTDK